MLVVADTTPLHYLVSTDSVHTLPELFEAVMDRQRRRDRGELREP